MKILFRQHTFFQSSNILPKATACVSVSGYSHSCETLAYIALRTIRLVFLKMGHSRPLFLYFRLFNIVDS